MHREWMGWILGAERSNKVWEGPRTKVMIPGGQRRFSSVIQSCPTLCDPMDCSTSGFPVHHQLSELVQSHVHCVSDAIQPSHPLSSPSPAFNLSQHQGLFQWVRLDEAQAGIKTAGRNINNLRYADNTTLIGRKWRRTNEPLDESERGEWKSWLKTQKTKIIASSQIDVK